jgi:hypothetical protein
MEKVPVLLQKLESQYQSKDWTGMQYTLQQLQSVLAEGNRLQSPPVHSSAKVAVVMPTPPPEHAIYLPAEKAPSPAEDESDWTQWSVRDVPTLSHQKAFMPEVNEALAQPTHTLNQRLSQPQKEIADRLNGSPISDLKKAIGINDRFLFIQELFRGDEVMYERSIKTINNFQILAEAEFWIERELRLKLGWQEGPASDQFGQLVRRRFSI